MLETISHTLSKEELTDIFGPDGWKQLPDEAYMRVKVEPARYIVEEHHVCVYTGKTTDKIVKAFRPKSLLRNSIVNQKESDPLTKLEPRETVALLVYILFADSYI